MKEIRISNEGSLWCRSSFYTSHDTLQLSMNFRFTTGVNKLIGDIDSGIWGISYLLSMFKYDVKEKWFLNPLVAMVDEKEMKLEELTKVCCYLDETMYPLFSSKTKSVQKMIEIGLKKSKKNITVNEVCNRFMLNENRIRKPIYCTGNEKFRAMSAVGYSFGKEVFCFPWLSKKMFDYYQYNLTPLFDVFGQIGAIAILPCGK